MANVVTPTEPIVGLPAAARWRKEKGATILDDAVRLGNGVDACTCIVFCFWYGSEPRRHNITKEIRCQGKMKKTNKKKRTPQKTNR